MKNNSVHRKADIDHLNKNLSDFSNTLTDVKIEVRYLSITLFEINANMRETAEMLQHHNDSMEHIKSDIADKNQKQTAALIEQKTRHTRVIGKCVFFLNNKFSQGIILRKFICIYFNSIEYFSQNFLFFLVIIILILPIYSQTSSYYYSCLT